jgi:hypothetical protein
VQFQLTGEFLAVQVSYISQIRSSLIVVGQVYVLPSFLHSLQGFAGLCAASWAATVIQGLQYPAQQRLANATTVKRVTKIRCQLAVTVDDSHLL